jgi:hypothetical protein
MKPALPQVDYDLVCPAPSCGTVLHPHFVLNNGGHATQRDIERHALRQHFNHAHPGFSVRKATELIDLVTDTRMGGRDDG